MSAHLPQTSDRPTWAGVLHSCGRDSSGRESLPVVAPGVEYVDKAIAYITRGDRFVVFEEPHTPAAGIQIPGGTVEPGETLEAAVLREAFEETGLTDLRLVRALGSQLHRRPSGRVHRRHYFHLADRSTSEQSEWEHYEEHPHSGSAPVLYRLSWAALETPPALHAELDGGLRQLRLGLTRPHLTFKRMGARRYASRALIFDGSGRILLLSASVNGQRLWTTPGGGVQPGESYSCALLRELAEEVGLPVNLGPVVWVRRHSPSDSGRIAEPQDVAEHTELFFHARVDEPGYMPRKQDSYVVGHKWWSMDELRESREVFAPRSLCSLLQDGLSRGWDGGPVDVGL